MEPSGDKALTCSIKYRRRAPVRTTCLPCATWLKNQYQIKVNAFSLSTSFRSRKKTILGWRLMLQNLRSFVCCAKIVTPPPHLEKVISKNALLLAVTTECLHCIVQLTLSISSVCITVALVSSSML